MKTPNCPMCGKPAVEHRQALRFRRGDRVLAVETRQWCCPHGCAGPGGDVPYVFADLATMKENEATAREAWRVRFGEEMPPPGRAGRVTDDPRLDHLQVRLSKAEGEALDVARGDLSRSDFVRRAASGIAVVRAVDTAAALKRGRQTRARRGRSASERPRRPRGSVPVTPPAGWDVGGAHVR